VFAIYIFIVTSAGFYGRHRE